MTSILDEVGGDAFGLRDELLELVKSYQSLRSSKVNETLIPEEDRWHLIHSEVADAEKCVERLQVEVDQASCSRAAFQAKIRLARAKGNLKQLHVQQKEAADRCAAARKAAETANREREERLQSMCKRATQLLTELLSRLSGSSP